MFSVSKEELLKREEQEKRKAKGEAA
jgi:hypothetical protein